jgi:hypothetical protein
MSVYLESARVTAVSLLGAVFCTALLLAASVPHVPLV